MQVLNLQDCAFVIYGESDKQNLRTVKKLNLDTLSRHVIFNMTIPILCIVFCKVMPLVAWESVQYCLYFVPHLVFSACKISLTAKLYSQKQ